MRELDRRTAGVSPAAAGHPARPANRRGTRRPADAGGTPALRQIAGGRHWRTLMVGLLLAAAPTLHACAVCWGNPDDPLVKGANAGIWVLLSIVGVVQVGFIALFWSFWRKAREQQRFRASLRVVHPFDPVEPSLQRSSISGGGQQS